VLCHRDHRRYADATRDQNGRPVAVCKHKATAWGHRLQLETGLGVGMEEL
jgi:hypothetical protein